MSATLDTAISTDTSFRACERKIVCSPGGLVVEDAWQWRDPQKSELRWHFAPGYSVSVVDRAGRARVSDPSGAFFSDVIVRSKNIEIFEIFDFEFSEVYGRSENAKGLRIVLGSEAENLSTTHFEFTDSAPA
jgi:hypothetical protein